MHKNPVRLDSSLRARLLDEIVRLFVEKQVELLVVAGAVDHVHGVGLFPANEVRQLIGHAKRYSSHAIRNQIPGSVWGRKCGLKRITDKEQQRRTFNYIADHRDEGASVWTFRDAR